MRSTNVVPSSFSLSYVECYRTPNREAFSVQLWKNEGRHVLNSKDVRLKPFK